MKIHTNQNSYLFLHARESLGLKQKEVAAKANITAAALSLFEAGKTSLSTNTLIRLANVLNLNPDFIKGKSKNPFRSKDVIKFFFLTNDIRDSMLISKVIWANDELEFVTIYPYLESYRRFFSIELFNMMVPYAVAVRDSDGNMFLFSNRVPEKGVLQEIGEDLRSRLLPFLEINGKDMDKMKFRNELTEESYVKKIDEGTITRKDLEPLFAKFKKDTIASIANLTEEEIRLINKLRENKIKPADVDIPKSLSRSLKKNKAS